jgi:hypothetical protein
LFFAFLGFSTCPNVLPIFVAKQQSETKESVVGGGKA